MSHKSLKVAGLIDRFRGREFDAHYLGFFDCFNRQEFFEAHEVLEELWLAQRGQAKDLFYKGLIQLAGAFVHVQKQRLKQALALLALAEANLGTYPGLYDGLDLQKVKVIIGSWRAILEDNARSQDDIAVLAPPKLMPPIVLP
jgi:predicted metal-dependent hydrolase